LWHAIALALALAGSASPVRADDTAEAAALFSSGNQHLQAAARARGPRRTRELEAALADYFASLRIVRSRNVLFNASLALEMLGRTEEAFNHLVEYLGVPGLSEAERAEATRRLEALRPNVAVLSIRSTPPGAEVWVDRRDLAPRGRTPLELALPAGEHEIWLRAPHHREAQAHATAATGATQTVEVTLAPEPVRLQVLAPADLQLTLDGAPIAAGANVDVLPGVHVVRLEIDGAPAIERRFEVLPGAAPMTIDLEPAVQGIVRRVRSGATLRVLSDVAAQVLIDGTLVGFGSALEVPVPDGEHEITVRADGHEPFVGRRVFTAGERSALAVALSPSPRGGSLTAPRILLGVASGLGLLGGVGLTVAAIRSREDFDRCAAQGLADCAQRADRAETLNLAGDITWVATAAIGATTFVLLFVDDRGRAEPSVGTFSLAALPGGAAIAWSIPLGGAL
jgi:hypothetical protein